VEAGIVLRVGQPPWAAADALVGLA
jgi:hypothetical protein